MKVRVCLAIAVMVSAAIALPARAAVDCQGTVTSLSLNLNADGTITLSLSGGPSYVYLCNTEGTMINGVPLSVCRSMYATLMAAKLADKKVSIRFYDYASCAAVPPWGLAGALGWNQVLID